MPQLENESINIDEDGGKTKNGITVRDIATLTGVVEKDDVDKTRKIINNELNRNTEIEIG